MDKQHAKSADQGSIKEAAGEMDDTRKLPPDSKLEKAVEEAKATSDKGRQAEQQGDRR